MFPCVSVAATEEEKTKLFFFPYRRDVFACIGLPDGDSSWERSYSRWPLGVCDHLVPVHRQFHPEEWADRTRNLYNWSEPHDRCTYTESKIHCFLTNQFIAHILTVTEERHPCLENEILSFYLHNLTRFPKFCNNLF